MREEVSVMNYKTVLLIALVLIGAMIVSPVSAVVFDKNAPVGSEIVVSGNATVIDFDYESYGDIGTFFIKMDNGEWMILGGNRYYQGFGVGAITSEELVWQIKFDRYQQLNFIKNSKGWELVKVKEVEL